MKVQVPCIGLVLLVVAAALSIARSPEDRPRGRFAARQMLDRAERVFGAWTPEAGVVQLAANYCERPSANSLVPGKWVVTGTDRLGRDLGFLEWDSDTGDVVCASLHRFGKPEGAAATGMTRLEAVEAARWTLITLRLHQRPPGWRLNGSVVGCPICWYTYWRSEDRLCLVSVSASRATTVRVLLSPRGEPELSGAGPRREEGSQRRQSQ